MRHFNVRLAEPEIDFLQRQAKANDRTTSAELRRLIRAAMGADPKVTTVQPLNFGRM